MKLFEVEVTLCVKSLRNIIQTKIGLKQNTCHETFEAHKLRNIIQTKIGLKQTKLSPFFGINSNLRNIIQTKIGLKLDCIKDMLQFLGPSKHYPD